MIKPNVYDSKILEFSGMVELWYHMDTIIDGITK